MSKSRGGFMLLEAILSVVIASICLTFIAQALLTNFRTGVRFQETVRSLMAMENKLGLLYVTDAAQDQLDPLPAALEVPYDKFTVRSQADPVNDHLKKVTLNLEWPLGRSKGSLEAATLIYSNPYAFGNRS